MSSSGDHGVRDSAATIGLLVGRFTHALDPKRRLTIPSGWRDQMSPLPLPAATEGRPAAALYAMPDLHKRCLNLFPMAEMEQRLMRLRQRAISDAQAAEFARRLGEVSEFLLLDVQGRIRIRDSLLRFAGLEAQVVMIGALNRIELWSPENKPEVEEIDAAGLAAVSQGIDF